MDNLRVKPHCCVPIDLLEVEGRLISRGQFIVTNNANECLNTFAKNKKKYKQKPKLLIKYDNMQNFLYMYTQCKQNMHSPVHQTQLFQ